MKRYRLAQPWMFKDGKPDEHTIYTENRKGNDGWGEYMRLDADVIDLVKRVLNYGIRHKRGADCSAVPKQCNCGHDNLIAELERIVKEGGR